MATLATKTENSVYISVANIVDLFLNEVKKGTMFAEIKTLTTVKLNGGKKNPQVDNVKKLVRTLVQISSAVERSAYELKVNRRLASEGKVPNFVAGSRVWGHRVADSSVIEHKGVFYLEYTPLNNAAKEKPIYFFNGKKIEKSDLVGLPMPTAVNEESQGGLTDKVAYNNVKFENIVSIKMNKTLYIIKG